jgi:hypothetical protein
LHDVQLRLLEQDEDPEMRVGQLDLIALAFPEDAIDFRVRQDMFVRHRMT